MNSPLVILWLTVTLMLGACTPTLMLPGPQTVAATLNHEYYITADNLSLPVKRWLPENQPITSIIIALHGFNDYSNFFDESARQLSAQGVASFAYDQRGFGGAPHLGIWAGGHTMAQDLIHFIALIKKQFPGIAVYLLGESMGGAVVMVAMTQPKPPLVQGIILAAPAVWGKSTMPWYQRWALTLGSYTLPWLKLSPNGLKIKASDNITMLRKLGRDPYIIKETRIDAMHGLTQLMGQALKRASLLPSNTLILYGERDEVIPKLPTAIMLDKLEHSSKNQKVAVYEQGYHMLLRDLQASVPREDILAWIKNPEQALPSGADQRSFDLLRWRTSKK